MSIEAISAPVEEKPAPTMLLASAVSDRVEIEELRITHASASCTIVDLANGPQIQLKSEMAVVTEVRAAKIDVFPRFAIIGYALNDDKTFGDEVLRVECRYRIRYRLSSIEGFDQRKL